MGQAKKDPAKLTEAEAAKAQVKANADRLAQLEAREAELADEIPQDFAGYSPDNRPDGTSGPRRLLQR